MKLKPYVSRGDLPRGRILIINPPYVHYSRIAGGGPFLRDPSPCLPLAPMYAGSVLEALSAGEVEYFDCQFHDLTQKVDFAEYDAVAIAVMGAQNLAPASDTFRYLTGFIPAERVHVGGQAAEALSETELAAIFPGARRVPREALQASPAGMKARIGGQIDKLSEEDQRAYLTSELILPFSQGCMFGCNFCGAQIRQREQFFDTAGNLEDYVVRAKKLGIDTLSFYCTSLDFFQQALPGGDMALLAHRLEQIIEIGARHDIKLRLRALCRADSYAAAAKNDHLFDLLREAGFHTFGFGADGAASTTLLRAMKRGSDELGSDLLASFAHAEAHGLVPEILYVFGIPEDTVETLEETKALCTGLLREFPTSVYRGFPAKNQIPGNRNWQSPVWQGSTAYSQLMTHPELFANLGFEALGNETSHPGAGHRKLVNRYAIEMSQAAHEMGRVLSYLTIPVTIASDPDLMDEASFDIFRDIVARYAPEIASGLTLKDLPARRQILNEMIPKDQ